MRSWLVVCLALGSMGIGSGCGAPSAEAWEQARLACGLDDGQHPTGALVDGGPSTPLSADCAAWLGDDLGLDWASFGAEPGDVFGAEPGDVATADDSLSLVLLGAHQLVAGDYGTVGQLFAADSASAWGLAAFSDLASDLALGDDDPAGALFYAHLLHRVDRVELDPELSGVGAVYNRGTMRVPVMTAAHQAPPLWMASVFVHEASHARGPDHVPCDQPADCDPDLDGIYGTQAWLLDAHAGQLDPADPLATASCAEAMVDLANVCRMVIDPGGDPLCDPEVRAARCSDG